MHDSSLILYFGRNIKGDVIGIYNASGAQIAKVSLHSWGKYTPKTLVSNSFSSYNPIRYRGYYYDRETTLYYLNARYLDKKSLGEVNLVSVALAGVTNAGLALAGRDLSKIDTMICQGHMKK